VNGPEIHSIGNGTPNHSIERGTPTRFDGVLQQKLTLSRHAAARIQQRRGNLAPEEWQQLLSATQAAGKSGAKQAAVVMPGGIYIVAPQSGTVITTIDRTNHVMQVISNVDALVLVGRTDNIPEASPSRMTDGGTANHPVHWSLLDDQNT
jgi:flagellar operon protein